MICPHLMALRASNILVIGHHIFPLLGGVFHALNNLLAVKVWAQVTPFNPLGNVAGATSLC